MKRLLRAMGLALIPLSIGAVSLEIGLRLIPQSIPLSVLIGFEPSLRSEVAERRNLQRRADMVVLPRDDGGPAQKMWVFKPGAEVRTLFDDPELAASVRMDDAGFCNSTPDAYDAPRFDVFALGDSFTFCRGVEAESSWPAQLEAMTGLRTYNAGIPGRGPYEYVQILKTFGLQKHPDYVVFAIYEGNDLRDSQLFHQARAHPGQPDDEVADRLCAWPSARLCAIHQSLDESPLGRHSYLYNFVSSLRRSLARGSDAREIDFRYEVEFPDGIVLPFNSVNGDRDEVQFARWLEEGKVTPSLFDDALLSLHQLADEHGFLPILLYLPSAYTAYDELSRFDDPEVERVLRAYSQHLRRYFARKGDEFGYPFLDMTPFFQDASARLPSSEKLYFQSNVHLTPRGHALVAAKLAALLAEIRSSGG